MDHLNSQTFRASKMKMLRIILSFFFASFALPVFAANSLDVIINEIAWMGSNISPNDEWIELYNNTEREIDLEDWILKAEDGSPEIKLKGVIPAHSFYLLERSDDNTIPEIPADLIYKGSLKNSGEDLKLFNKSGNLIDRVNCKLGWFAGNNRTKQTMERKNPRSSGSDFKNWQESQESGGTPKSINSTFFPLNENVSDHSLPQEIKRRKRNKEYPSGVIFNEILPSPEGPDRENEWIELFNQNNFEVDLSGWKITDEVGSTHTFIIPEKTKIPARGFLLLSRPLTKIILNNNKDTLKLLQPNGNILDEVTFEKALIGSSYNLTSEGWVWSSILTPGKKNIISHPEKFTQKMTFQKASKKESVLKKKTLAPIQEALEGKDLSLPQTSPFWRVLLIGFLTATFSGIIFLILKKKIEKRKILQN